MIGVFLVLGFLSILSYSYAWLGFIFRFCFWFGFVEVIIWR